MAVFFLALAGAAAGVRADDQIRDVQQSLKDAGFYYGDVDGEEGSETGAAIRRYQIRNGLEVTGKLNPQTLQSLHLAGEAGSAPEQAPPSPPSVTPHSDAIESDRSFLRKPVPKPAASPAEEDESAAALPPAAPPRYSLPALFQRTPYENAPLIVQRDTLKRAQVCLGGEGFYRGPVDGAPGFETERALRSYQRAAGLDETGRLDLDTLAEMNLLPGRRIDAPPPHILDEPPTRRVYRGIWVR